MNNLNQTQRTNQPSQSIKHRVQAQLFDNMLIKSYDTNMDTITFSTADPHTTIELKLLHQHTVIVIGHQVLNYLPQAAGQPLSELLDIALAVNLPIYFYASSDDTYEIVTLPESQHAINLSHTSSQL